MCGMVLKIVYLEITTMLSLNGKDKNICFETKKKILQLCTSVSPYLCWPPLHPSPHQAGLMQR